MAHIGAALPKVANAIKKAFNPDGLNIIQNNGEFAINQYSIFISISCHDTKMISTVSDTIGKHMRTKLMMNKTSYRQSNQSAI